MTATSRLFHVKWSGGISVFRGVNQSTNSERKTLFLVP